MTSGENRTHEEKTALRDLRWQAFGQRNVPEDSPIGLRLLVPGGWLVSTYGAGNAEAVFVPDPDHSWDRQHAAHMAARSPISDREVQP